MSDFQGQQPGPQNPYQPKPQPRLPDPGQPEYRSGQQSPPKKPRKWLPWAVAAGTFVLGLVIGSAGSGSSATDAAAPAPTVTVTVPDTGPSPDPVVTPTNKPVPPPPKATAPTVKDFKLTVKTLTKQCFGSAGCNVTFRIIVAYSGPALDPSKEYEVLYEVRGGEDGPLANKLTVAGDESSVDDEEMVSTSKSSAKLTAVVTDVMES